MKTLLQNFTRLVRKRKATIVVVFSLLLLYIVLRILIFEQDPILCVVGYITDKYILMCEWAASLLLNLVGSNISVSNHQIIPEPLNGVIYSPELWYKKVTILVLFLIWITNSPLKKQLAFSFLTLATQYIAFSVYIAVGTYLSGTTNYDPSLITIIHTLALSCFNLIVLIWYNSNKNQILTSFAKHKLDIVAIETKAIPAFILMFCYIIIVHLIIPLFEFESWINFLFLSTQKVLALFGVESIVEPSLLIGDNGSIYMAKYCLGIQTMFLFSSLVYITGDKTISRWLYIFIGLVILNIVNILRFTFLFVHIQKHADYTLAISVHEMYNYITYSIVFILWVIWFEFFSEIRFINKKRSESSHF